MPEDEKDWSSPKAVYGVMFSLTAALSGAITYLQTNSRPDPYTGTQGHHVEKQVEDLQAAFSYFVERGPVDVIRNQDEIIAKLRAVEHILLAMNASETVVRKRHDEMAKDVDAIERVLIEEEKSDNRFHADMKQIHQELDKIYEAVRK